MIYKLKSILLFVAILIGLIANGQNHYHFKASHLDYSSKDTIVEINFDIKHFKDYDIFNVKLSALDENQKSYNVNSLFEHKDLKGGKNTIFWNPLLDGYKLDGDYKINLELRKSSSIKIPYRKHLIHSVLFPGWGDMKLRNTNKLVLFGIGALAYGSLFYSLDYNTRANKNYNAYINSYNVEESDNYFLNAKKEANISRILAGLTAITWSADLMFLSKRIKKVKNDRTLSDFYNKMQNRVHSTKYKKYNYLNTKPIEEKYLDSAIVEYENEKYYKSENLLKIAQTFQSKDTLVSQKIQKYASIVKDELDFIAYNKLGDEKIEKLQLIGARRELIKAQKIKPNNRGVVNKIDSINNYYTFLKKGDKYYKLKDYDNAQLNYENAYKVYETDSSKFKVLISKADNYYTQKFYLRSEIEYEKALRLYSNNLVIKQKIKDLNVIINKINSDNKEFALLSKKGDQNSNNFDFDNALINYKAALKIKPKNKEVFSKIEKINNYKNLIKKGDLSFKNKIYNVAKTHYTNAQKLFNSYEVKSKIEKTEGEILRFTIVDEGTQYFNKAEKLRISKKYEEAKNNFELALEKFKKADEIRQTTIITNKISITNSKLKICNDNLKKGMKLLDDEFIEVYNKNNLKIEIKFSFGDCNMKANMYSYRYSGNIGYSKKYLNWKVDYTDCNGRDKVFGRGVEIGGNRLINEIGSNPEDIITEGFDDQFQGEIKSKIYNLKISNYTEKIDR